MLLLGIVALAVVAAAAWLYTPDRGRAALEARYAPPPSVFTTVLGVRLHLRDTGPRDAPAVILLHGFAASLHTWETWAEALQTDHRVIRYDQPGFGLTGADPQEDYSDERSLAVLRGLMDHLGVARATIVGNSMGGRIAWRFAAQFPDRVQRLVLISPDGFASPGLEYGRAPKIPLLMRALPYVLPTQMLRMSLAPAYGDASVMTPDLVARYRDMMLAPGVRDAIVARMGQTVLVDPIPLLRTIAAPTLLMWGDKDAMVPPANAADYLASLPHAHLASLAGIGHLPQEEAPATTLPTLRAFIDHPN